MRQSLRTLRASSVSEGGFFKKVRDSRFARLDTLAYSPLCACLALLTGIAAGT
jgi:hypothetical protein